MEKREESRLTEMEIGERLKERILKRKRERERERERERAQVSSNVRRDCLS